MVTPNTLHLWFHAFHAQSAPYWHAIHVQPMSTLMNLFNFVTLAAHFSKSRRERIGVEAFRNLHTFEFNFSPDHIQGTGQHHDNVVYGTGGQLLKVRNEKHAVQVRDTKFSPLEDLL